MRKIIVCLLSLAIVFTLCFSVSFADAGDTHFMLQNRDYGPCDKLLGDAYILLVFVSTPQHPWTQAQKDNVNRVSASSVQIMEAEAERYGADLNLRYGGLDFSVPCEFSSDLQWYNHILENIYHESSIVDVYRRYENDLNVDSASMIFLFNSWDVSHAYVASRDYPHWNQEFCVIFCDTDMHDNYLTHELLHLYGASDFYDYNGEGVQRIAERYFPNSDMLYVSHEVDELTAYLIGWTDQPSDKALQFLDETDGLR